MASNQEAAGANLAVLPGGAALRLPWHRRIQGWIGVFGIWIGLCVLIIFIAFFEPTLLSGENIRLLLRQSSIVGLLAIGQTAVMLTGGIDLSVGSIVAVINWVCTIFLAGSDDRNLGALALCLGIGAGIGLINGLGITKLHVPPFVMTLGMLFAVLAAGFIYTDGITRGAASPLLLDIGGGYAGPVPIAFVVFGGTALLVLGLLRATPYGRQVYAIGANVDAARMSGINVSRVLILTYVLSGVTAAMGGLILSGYIGIGDNTSGQGLELDSIAAVVVGGTLLAGGRGSIIGTVGGVLFLGLLYNLLIILNIAQSGRLIVQGSVIVIAAAVYSSSRRR